MTTQVPMTAKRAEEVPAIKSLPEVVKALSEIRTERQVREMTEETEKDPDIIALGEEIKANGLHSPPIIDPTGLLIIGERRLTAMRAVGITHASFKVYSGPLTPTTRILLQTGENVHRKALKPWDLSAAMLKLRELNSTWTNKDLAKRVHLGESLILRYLAITDCIPDVEKAYRAGTLRLTSMYAISKLPHEEQAEALALALAGTKRDQLESHGRKKRNGNAPAVRVSSIRCPLSSGTTVVVKGNEISLDDAIEALTELLKAMKKASEEGIDGKTFARVCADKAKKGL